MTIFAEPIEDSAAPQAEGATGNLPVLAAVLTDAQGSFAASAPSADLTAYKDSTGNLNMRAVAADTSGNVADLPFTLQTVYYMGSPILRPAKLNNLNLAPPAQSVEANTSALIAESPDPSGYPATSTDGLDEATGTETAQPVAANDPLVSGSGSSVAAAPSEIAICSWNLVKDLGLRTVWVGGTYVTTTGVTADFQYSAGASSALGVGASTSGSFGTFRGSSARRVSSTGTIDFPASSTLQHDYTMFRYGKYAYSCSSLAGYKKFEVRPRYWAGGAHVWKPAAAPTANYCTPYPAGSSQTLEQYAAYEFSTGADLAGVIGVNLSAQTGYSKAAKMVYTFKSAHKLCGTNDYPGGVVRRVVAKS